MIAIEFSSNIKAFRRGLRRVERRQLPFAISRALTSTAFAVRQRQVKVTFPRDFDLRNRRFPAVALRVRKARKTDLRASVFDRLGRDYLSLQAAGGTKRPARASALAIPSRNVPEGRSARVTKGRRPRALLDRPDVFQARLRKAEPAIWQRSRRGLKLLYTRTKQAAIPRRLRFYQDARRAAARHFPRALAVEFRRAMRTAR